MSNPGCGPPELTESKLKVEIYLAHPDAKLPTKGTPESAGWDLYSVEEGWLSKGNSRFFSTGLIIRPPEGYHIKILARSGWGRKFNIGIPHGIGLIDRDFAGKDDIIGISLSNSNDHVFIKKGERIAQMIIEKTIDTEFCIIDHPPSNKTRGGWGSTNKETLQKWELKKVY